MTYSAERLQFLKDQQAPILAQAVEPESHFYWQAYHHLRGEGYDSMGPKPIPFGAIVGYAEWAGIECSVEQARLVKIVMAMDNAGRGFAEKRGKG